MLKSVWHLDTHEKRCTESHFSLMKSLRYFMNSRSVTIGSSSMLNLLSADQVSIATSTIRVLSCSLKIWGNGWSHEAFGADSLTHYSRSCKKKLSTVEINFRGKQVVIITAAETSGWSMWSCLHTQAAKLSQQGQRAQGCRQPAGGRRLRGWKGRNFHGDSEGLRLQRSNHGGDST